MRSNREALQDYFVNAFKVLPGVKVAFGDQLIRVYGNAAINTGNYTFSYVRDGEAKNLPARYSFTYVKNGERWLIVDHHSSAMTSPLEVPWKGVVSGLCHRKWLGMPGIRRCPGRDSTTLSNLRI